MANAGDAGQRQAQKEDHLAMAICQPRRTMMTAVYRKPATANMDTQARAPNRLGKHSGVMTKIARKLVTTRRSPSRLSGPTLQSATASGQAASQQQKCIRTQLLSLAPCTKPPS